MPDDARRPGAGKTNGRRTALGADPLGVLDAPPARPTPVEHREEHHVGNHVAAPAERPTSIPEFDKVTARLPGELLAEIRAACVTLAGPPERLNMTAFAERAFRTELERLRAKHNGGAPFPLLGEKLRGGRPIGS